MNVKTMSDLELTNLLHDITNELKQRLIQKTVTKISEPVSLRHEVIKLAKAELSKMKKFERDFYSYKGYAVVPEFIINKEKRTVVVLLKGYHSGNIRSKAKAKCNPEDTFNVHIGKAIALYRGLGKKVPEYLLNPPNPTVAEEGDLVEYQGKVRKINNRLAGDGKHASIGSVVGKYGKIIDDSKE